MKDVLSRTRWIAASTSGRIERYWAARSTSGIRSVSLPLIASVGSIGPICPEVGCELDHPRRVADDDRTVRHVVNDDAPGADERVPTDDDARQERRGGPDLRATPDDRTAEGGLCVGAERVAGVRERHGRPDPRPLLEHRELRDERVRMDARPVADDDVVFHDRMRPDAHVTPDLVRLADHHPVTRLEPVTDRRPAVD